MKEVVGDPSHPINRGKLCSKERLGEASVVSATNLFNNARVEYIEVLFAQRDLRDARMVLIDTKRQQLSAIVNAYQAIGGGDLLSGLDAEAGGCHGPHDPAGSDSGDGGGGCGACD